MHLQRSVAFALSVGILLATGCRPATDADTARTPAGQVPAPSETPAHHDDAAFEALLAQAGRGELAPLEAALPELQAPAQRALAQARIAAARLEDTSALRALDAYFNSGDSDPRRQAAAWSLRTEVAFTQGDYAAAREAATEWARLLADNPELGDAQGAQQVLGIAHQLADTPRQEIVSRQPDPVRWHRDKAGLIRVDAQINGIPQEAVVDTGANLSVVSVSTAERVGVRMAGGRTGVGTGTRSEISAGLGIADAVTVAGTTLHNVVFLVLDDEQLQMPLPGGYDIPAIIGFPVLRALGQITFTAEGQFSTAPPAVLDRDVGQNLRIVGNDLFVDATVNAIPVVLHLDTGAPASSLSSEFAGRHPAVLEGLERREVRTASAGGTTSHDSAIWTDVTIEVAGQSHRLPELAIATAASEDVKTRNLGILGTDVLGAYPSYTVDFDQLRVTLQD